MTFSSIPKNSTVLDIGCSGGNFAEELIRQKQCIVDGIEINPADVKIAQKKLRNVYQINVEHDKLPDNKYNVIFMGDVIEHLANPVAALLRLSSLLEPNGIIVFSIPNITHMLVRLMLLKGDIVYGRTGLLDETHLHFYNQTEVYRVFNEAGYNIKNINYVQHDIPLDVLQKEFQEIGLKTTDKFYELAQSTDAATYQFVGVAKLSNKKQPQYQKLPQKSPISINNEHFSELHKKLDNLWQDVNIIKRQRDDAKEEVKLLRGEYNNAIRSNSYKIGRKLTLPIRAVKKTKHYAKKTYVKSRNINGIKDKLRTIYKLNIPKIGKSSEIALIIRSIEHPTSSTFIRLVSPLSNSTTLNRRGIDIVDGNSPKLPKHTKVAVVQRTAVIDKETAINLIDEIKRNNIKLFVDTDDAFGELDEGHPQYKEQKTRVDALNYIIDNADEVWFSTEPLRKLHKVKSARVVRNTLDSRIWSTLNSLKMTQLDSEPPLRMVYMGTATHDEDFSMILPALEKLHQKLPGKFELHIIGVARDINKYPWVILHKPTSSLYPEFVKWFSNLPQFDIGLSPLVDNSFNHNKSDIKCLDYLANGIKPVVSNVKAYENSELDKHIVRVDNTEDDWYQALKHEIDSKAKSRMSMPSRAKAGFDYINNYRSTKQAADTIRASIERVENKNKR